MHCQNSKYLLEAIPWGGHRDAPRSRDDRHVAKEELLPGDMCRELVATTATG